MSDTPVEPRVDNPVTELAAEATRLGAAWARYGLVLGQAALETSAETLRGTAGLLAKIGDALARKAG